MDPARGPHPAREFDLLVYGASGFVGRRVLACLAGAADAASLRLAVAGRDRGRLEAARTAAGGHAGRAAVLVADSGDRRAVDAAVARARVVLSVAGPFAQHGGPVVDACVRFGTHYVDITGETLWVRGLIDRYHERAAAAGTRLIPCCGFDSVPSDLGVLVLADHARHVLGTGCGDVRAYFRMQGGLNGGTIASALHTAASADRRRAGDPFLLAPGAPQPRAGGPRDRDPSGAAWDADIRAWVAPFVMGPVNTRVVRRSAALHEGWGEPYGADFHYQEFARVDPPMAGMRAVWTASALAAFGLATRSAVTRRWLARLLPAPGEGPSERSMAEGWFRADLLGRTEDGRSVTARVQDTGDPGNTVTARCVAEAALALALDRDALPGGRERGGVLTPATGLGHVLVDRLRRAGMTIQVEPSVR